MLKIILLFSDIAEQPKKVGDFVEVKSTAMEYMRKVRCYLVASHFIVAREKVMLLSFWLHHWNQQAKHNFNFIEIYQSGRSGSRRKTRDATRSTTSWSSPTTHSTSRETCWSLRVVPYPRGCVAISSCAMIPASTYGGQLLNLQVILLCKVIITSIHCCNLWVLTSVSPGSCCSVRRAVWGPTLLTTRWRVGWSRKAPS